MYEVDILAIGEATASGDAITLRFTVPGTTRLAHVIIDGGFQSDGDKVVDRFTGSGVRSCVTTSPCQARCEPPTRVGHASDDARRDSARSFVATQDLTPFVLTPQAPAQVPAVRTKLLDRPCAYRNRGVV